MESIKLSICIPTYNRAKYLPELFESIISQAGPYLKYLEVCISDNASTDNTDQVVEKYENLLPNIVYHKNIENLGPDRNYLKVVEIASGEYCWIVGSDDALDTNAIKTIFEVLCQKNSIILFNRKLWYLGKKICNEQKWLKQNINTYIFDANDPKEFSEYCSNAVLIGALFSYLSAIVFRRSLWNQQVQDAACYIGSSYVHVAVLFFVIKKNTPCLMMYLNKSLVLSRTGNDSFSVSIDMLKRNNIDLVGYRRLSEIFDDQRVRIRIMGVLSRTIKIDLSFIKLIYLSSNSTIETIETTTEILKGERVFRREYMLISFLKIFYKVKFFKKTTSEFFKNAVKIRRMLKLV